MLLDKKYSNIMNWIADGIIELGGDGYSDSTARVIDHGGIVWETNQYFATLDEMLDAVEEAIGTWCKETGVEWKD